MRNILVVALMVFSFTPATAQGWSEGHTYHCNATATFELADNANPDRHFRSKSMSRVFTYEEASGRLHWTGDDITWEFTTVQRGDTQRAMKAVRVFTGSAATALETLHIATWEAREVGVVRHGVFPFLYNSDATVYSGTCALD